MNLWKRFTAWLYYLRHPCTIITMDEAPAKGVNVNFTYTGEYPIAKIVQEGMKKARETEGRVALDWPYGEPFKFAERANTLLEVLSECGEHNRKLEENMRSEVINCDGCGKAHDAQYVLPAEWVEIAKRDGFGNDESMHFCSKTCLIKWASQGQAQVTPDDNGVSQEALDRVEERLANLHTSIVLIHPKEAATGTAGIMSQMMVAENLKEDFKKLSEAIEALKKGQ